MPGPVEPYGREGLPLSEARHRLLADIRPINALTTVSLEEALGRVNARSITAQVSIPGFQASIMDGYALGQNKRPTVGQHWTLQGRSAPGSPFDRVLNAGEAIRILTGAPLPEGAGWVLPQECAETSQTQLTLAVEVSDQPWIRAEDEECKTGDLLINHGQRLTPSQLGRLAGCGVATLQVHQKPRIGLLISGDELVPAGLERRTGEIWESNGTLLEAILHNLRQVVHSRCVVPDQPEALRQALAELSQTCDVVVSTGGISAGDTDWIRELVNELGQVSFWKLFLKPGRPFAFGHINSPEGNVPFFGLPGNPVAAAITALQLLWPALQLLEGQEEPDLFPRVKVKLANALARRPGRPELARAQLEVDASGELMARVSDSQASSRIGSLLNSDLLLEIPAQTGGLEAGESLWAQLIRTRLL
ncbi:molybdopterin molybdotransferase MoeA [Synechococcus sp. Cu2B8-bc1011]|uniref:molybdopterin molybdotransferase MoeA n=1 Tax=Synechococcus sp. Cu2B8-bc1011 TaxID=3093725 RepID=UPI0039AF1D53